MEETNDLPANGPQSSSSCDTWWINAQPLKLQRLTGSHQYKIHFVISFLFNIAFIITIIVLAGHTALTLQRMKEPPAGPCPESWVGYQGRCYYFSETEGTWDFGQRNCSSYGASLAAIDAPWELEFLKLLRGHSDRWIGLHREEIGKPWKWTDGSTFSNWFNITASGLCVYLRNGASSTWCDTRRRWICRKP